MKEKEMKTVWEQVAENHGVSANEVRTEIEAAIRLTLTQLRDKKQHNMLKHWDEIPTAGAEPTPEELVAYLAYLAKHQNSDKS